MRIYPLNKRRLAKVAMLLMVTFLFITLFLYYILNEIKSLQQQLELLKTEQMLEIKGNVDEILIELEKHVKMSEEKDLNTCKKNAVKYNSSLKYILQWTNPTDEPFIFMGFGQEGFIGRKCKYTNCFVTSDKNLLGDVSKFDVIAFAGPEVSYTPNYEYIRSPSKRSPHQKYAFATVESAANYPTCFNTFDNFFNWTWTYRLDSETNWGYIVVRDANHKIIGPKIDMHWMKLEDMDPVSEELAANLRNKTLAAAWFVSNCDVKNHRDDFVNYLQRELYLFDLELDIYGDCGPLKCERGNAECLQIIKRDYYFYMSFENSFSKDYVTEKLLYGLKYNAIPIVYGGANYTRFMPDGIYLNARELGYQNLAKKMKYLIDHPAEYREYFRWKNHYSYYNRDESAETNDYCGFCRLLNNEKMVKTTSIYKNFKEWWNDDDVEACKSD